MKLRKIFCIVSVIGAIYAFLSPALILVALVLANGYDNGTLGAKIILFGFYLGLNVLFSGAIGGLSGAIRARYFAPLIVPVAMLPLSLTLLLSDPLLWIAVCATFGAGLVATVTSSAFYLIKKQIRKKITTETTYE